MNDEESLPPTISVDSPASPQESPVKSNPYELLIRQSRKMGGLATRTYDITKEFLKKDVTTLNPSNPDTILFGKRLKQKTDERSDIRSLVRRSHEVLASVRTVILPVNLFPDTITVDRTKITIHKRTFFWSAQVISIRIEDILNVACSVGPLFGSLTISSRVMNSTDHFEINYFWRKDALYMKQLIQGYFIAQHDAIETGQLSRQELIETLLELGSDSVS
ncbi:MAG TPA: hypothetical protein VGE34_01380 [Candidatus Saccharimonadales bacterium]